MKNSEAIYPVIGLSKDGTIVFKRAPEDFNCTKPALKSNYYLYLKIVDAEGTVYKVENAVTGKRLKKYWGESWWTNFTMPSMFNVKIELSRTNKKYTFEEFKNFIVKNYINRGYFSSFIEENELIFKAKSSENFSQLGKLLIGENGE